MAKDIKFNIDARARMKEGVDALADAVTQRITNLQMQRNAAYA